MTRALLSCKAAKTAAAVNALRSARIPFSGGRRRGGEFLFRVPAGSADRALKALKERGIDCVVLALGGRVRLKAALIKNAGTLAACALFIAACFVCSRFVFFTRVSGGDESERALAMQILREYAPTGSLKSKVDLNGVRSALYENIPSLAFVSLKIRGSAVRAELVMQNEAPAPVQSYENIYAAEDGIVEKLTVLSGTACVREGDAVKKGDLLIAGKRVVGTNDKGDEIFERCPAAGTVTARVYVGGRRLLPESRVTAVPTGRRVTFTLLDLCGVVWGKDKGSPFENFIRREEEELFCALPAFSLTRITYEEIKYEVCALTEGDLDACAAQMRAEFAPLIAGARVLNSYNNIKKLDNCYALDIYYEVVREIAEGG